LFLFEFQIKQNSLDGGGMEPHFTDENKQNIVDKTSAQPIDSNRTKDSELCGLDSGIAGSYRETSSGMAVSLEGHRKAASYTDAADMLIACAEEATFFSGSVNREREARLLTKDTGGSEEEKEKFTTETGMVSSTRRVSITVEECFLYWELRSFVTGASMNVHVPVIILI
jgi:hypothetical protein